MKKHSTPGISFSLRPLPPFSLELTVWALRRRANNEIDRWDGRNYSRIFVIEGKPLKVSVSQEGGLSRARLHIEAAGATSDLQTVKSSVSAKLGKMLAIKKDLREFYSLSGKNKRLMPLSERFAGMKPPRFPTVFEALVNALACQQVSLDLGIILLNRLSRSYGAAFGEDETFSHAFPGPEALAGLSPDDFRRLGFSKNKGRAIIELSERVLVRKSEIEKLEKMPDTDAVRYLSEIRGVGRWTAEYVLLRGLGRINIFPGDDVGAQKNLQKFMGLSETPDYEQVKRITSRWEPYAGFVYFQFLLDKLMTKGYLS